MLFLNVSSSRFAAPTCEVASNEMSCEVDCEVLSNQPIFCCKKSVSPFGLVEYLLCFFRFCSLCLPASTTIIYTHKHHLDQCPLGFESRKSTLMQGLKFKVIP